MSEKERENTGKGPTAPSRQKQHRHVKRADNLAEFFSRSPLAGSKVNVERVKDAPRKLELSGRRED
jgi:hypothetical protein